MSLIHVGREVLVSSGSHLEISSNVTLPVMAAAVVLFHSYRAARLSDEVAHSWLLTRGLTTEARSVAEIRTYLRRLRGARLIGALILLGFAVLSLNAFDVPIGIASAPYLLSVLAAELLTAEPRRGRERVASLVRRPSDFFAPHRPVLFVRTLLGLDIVLTSIALSYSGAADLRIHLAMLLLGAAAYQACLRRVSERALPSAVSDLQRDTAVRVASCRTSTAAALSFAAFGLLTPLSQITQHQANDWVGRQVIDQLLTFGLPAAMAAVIWLVQPVRSWRPRPT